MRRLGNLSIHYAHSSGPVVRLRISAQFHLPVGSSLLPPGDRNKNQHRCHRNAETHNEIGTVHEWALSKDLPAVFRQTLVLSRCKGKTIPRHESSSVPLIKWL